MIKLQVVVIGFLLAPLAALAYSGAGGECGNGALEYAAINGTPKELESAIDKRVTEIERYVGEWSSAIAKLYERTSRVWLDPKVMRSTAKEKRSTLAKWWIGCQGVTLLDTAVAGANLENIDLLLALGADPNAADLGDNFSTVLMRCPHVIGGRLSVGTTPPRRTVEEQERVIKSYAKLLGAGAALNQANKHGQTALHLCEDPIVIGLLLASGADVLVNIDPMVPLSSVRDDLPAKRVFDHRIRVLIDYDEEWTREARFASLELIAAKLPDRRVTADTLRLISWRCKAERKASTCARLGAFVSVDDPSIFLPMSRREHR